MFADSIRSRYCLYPGLRIKAMLCCVLSALQQMMMITQTWQSSSPVTGGWNQ